jgi:hypothetical protein
MIFKVDILLRRAKKLARFFITSNRVFYWHLILGK